MDYEAHPDEPFRELVSNKDERVVDAVRDLVQRFEDERLETRAIEYDTLFGYFKAAAAENEGSVPIDVIESILVDCLSGKK